MLPWEKAEIQPIQDADRFEILRALGLASFQYLYEESSGNQILRLWESDAEGVRPLSPSLQQTPADLPVLTKKHAPQQLSQLLVPAGRTLWDELMPFPFSLFHDSQAVSDPAWQQALAVLVQAFRILEDQLHACEVSVLKVGAITLFAHSVRKRFTTLGRLLDAQTLDSDSLESIRKQGATSQVLELALGQTASFEEQCRLVADQIHGVATHGGASLASPEQTDSPAAKAPFPL